MADSLNFSIRNTDEGLVRAVHRMNAGLERLQLPQRTLYIATLAFEEILTNIYKYAYDDNGVHDIEFRLHVTDSELIMEFEDNGIEFDPCAEPDPDLQAPISGTEPGGLGIHLVRKMTDSMTYRRQDGRNILNIVVRICE
ncbi:ATP-binding protein [Thermodesulfobacteriota bacterium]